MQHKLTLITSKIEDTIGAACKPAGAVSPLFSPLFEG
jgi:hypothetical protein